MPERVSRFSLDQIGSSIARFSSSGTFETHKDRMVDPYALTRVPKEFQVECVQFWPQEKGRFPGIILLHERWGLTAQIKDIAKRLACEGFVVLAPNLYGRQGGMVTANAEVADALMSRIDGQHLIKDINACCEFLNSNLSEDTSLEFVKRNVHAVVGFGMGGTLALQFASYRRRLRAAVSFYGKIPTPLDFVKQLYCPVLYHAVSSNSWVTPEDIEQFRQATKEQDKPVEFRTYVDTQPGFCDEIRSETYRAQAASSAFETTVEFLHRYLNT